MNYPRCECESCKQHYKNCLEELVDVTRAWESTYKLPLQQRAKAQASLPPLPPFTIGDNVIFTGPIEVFGFVKGEGYTVTSMGLGRDKTEWFLRAEGMPSSTLAEGFIKGPVRFNAVEGVRA